MRRLIRPRVIVPVVLVGLALLIVALVAFQPWRLFTRVEVNEAIPTSAGELTASAAPASAPSTASNASQPPTATITSPAPAPVAPTVLATGSFISHEHPTTGTVRILQLADGSRVLRLEDLSTSDGPQVEVWLSNAPVIEGTDGYRVFDNGTSVSLGPLKGNIGNQNYAIPADLDLSKFSSVSLWCARFHVSFGAAKLTPA